MANNKKTPSKAIGRFFKGIGGFFAEFGTAVSKGDIFTKLSLIWMGAGYARHKQFIKAAIMTVLEAAVILFSILFASQYVPKFGTLGTVQAEMIFDPVTMKNIMNDYDNSFKILLYSLICFVVWIAFFFVWIKNTINSYNF